MVKAKEKIIGLELEQMPNEGVKMLIGSILLKREDKH